MKVLKLHELIFDHKGADLKKKPTSAEFKLMVASSLPPAQRNNVNHWYYSCGLVEKKHWASFHC